jgi:hypothetical protein
MEPIIRKLRIQSLTAQWVLLVARTRPERRGATTCRVRASKFMRRGGQVADGPQFFFPAASAPLPGLSGTHPIPTQRARAQFGPLFYSRMVLRY